jgi:hypothetical protein
MPDGMIPPALAKQPELDDDVAETYYAFYELNQCRQTGFGISPISASDIYAYAKMCEFDDLAHFFKRIKAMDAAFIEHNQPKK